MTAHYIPIYPQEDRAGIEDSASYINSLIEKEEQAGIGAPSLTPVCLPSLPPRISAGAHRLASPRRLLAHRRRWVQPGRRHRASHRPPPGEGSRGHCGPEHVASAEQGLPRGVHGAPAGGTPGPIPLREASSTQCYSCRHETLTDRGPSVAGCGEVDAGAHVSRRARPPRHSLSFPTSAPRAPLLPLRLGLKATVLTEIPDRLQSTGTYDQVVKETYGQRSAELIQKQLGMTVDYKRYPMPHSALPVRRSRRRQQHTSPSLPRICSACMHSSCPTVGTVPVGSAGGVEGHSQLARR